MATATTSPFRAEDRPARGLAHASFALIAALLGRLARVAAPPLSTLRPDEIGDAMRRDLGLGDGRWTPPRDPFMD
jgi:hypothetical protein